jgi:hypothetical protein
MRKVVVFLFLILSWSIINGQTGPVFQYTHPSKQILEELVKEETVKGYAYRTYLVGKINLGLIDTTFKVSASYVDFIFNHLYFEEVYLEEGNYMNSGYNPSTKKMTPSMGHKWTGFAWVFRIGTYSITVIKEDCGNILSGIVSRKYIPKPLAIIEQDDWSFMAPKKVYEQPPINLGFYKPPVAEKKHKWVKWVVGGVILSAATTAYLMSRSHHYDGGGPGGAPPTPLHERPTPIIPGGPGGAPPSPGGK